MHRVLIIEDDPDIGALVRLHASELPAETRIETTGPRGLFAAQGGTWDLIVLDWRLPGMDGVSLCRRLREQRHPGPILMLSARASEADRVSGLDAGADDYVAKPFGISELKARMRAQLRRTERSSGTTQNEAGPSPLRIGPITVDAAARTARCHDRDLQLTAREFDLLMHFARYPDRVFSRVQLLQNVWGAGFDGYEHTVNSHINRLRAKLESDPARPRLLVTVWGAGYRLCGSAAD